MKTIIAILLAAVCSIAQAQIYAGSSVGYGAGKASPEPSYTNIDVAKRQDSAVGSAFIGYRSGWWAVETGAMYLPEYHATASTQNYPAYKGCTLGPTCPQTASVTQEIFSRALYLRANAYAPFRVLGAEPYAFAGLAMTKTYNHEYGAYNGTERVDFKIDIDQRAYVYGVGLGVPVAGKLSARVEAAMVPSYVDEEHTLKRDAVMVTAGLVYSF